MVVLNSANCAVLTVQITQAKLGLTKLHLHPSGRGAGAELEIEDVVVSSLAREKTLSGAANASAEPIADFPK